MDGRRGSYRVRSEPDPIDLGNEPPLSVDGETHGVIDRRRVSAQWFSGTILTGLCGAALMGGAVFTSLDGEAHFAALPERVETALRGAVDRLSGARKADKLPPVGENTAARLQSLCYDTAWTAARRARHLNCRPRSALAAPERRRGIRPRRPARAGRDGQKMLPFVRLRRPTALGGP